MTVVEVTMLQVVVEHTADTVVLRCVGRIVAGEEVHALQDTVVSHTDKHVVLLDLAGVDSIDAAGLGLLMFFQTLGRALGFELTLLQPSERVREMLEITNLTLYSRSAVRTTSKRRRTSPHRRRNLDGRTDSADREEFRVKNRPKEIVPTRNGRDDIVGSGFISFVEFPHPHPAEPPAAGFWFFLPTGWKLLFGEAIRAISPPVQSGIQAKAGICSESLILAITLKTWDEGLPAFPGELSNTLLHFPPSMKPRLSPMAANAR